MSIFYMCCCCLGPRHALVSTFYNDMFAFDLERRRWYKLGLKQKKAKLSTTEKKEARRVKQKSAADGAEGGDGDDLSDNGSGDEGSDMDDSDDDDEEGGAGNTTNTGAVDAVRAEKGDFFGYIDETGNVVYINLKDEDEGEGGMQVEPEAALGTTTAAVADGMDTAADITMQSAADGFDRLAVSGALSAGTEAVVGVEADTLLQELRNKETLKNQLKYQMRSRDGASLSAGDAYAAAEGAAAGGDGDGMVLDEVTVDVAGVPVSGVKAGATTTGKNDLHLKFF